MHEGLLYSGNGGFFTLDSLKMKLKGDLGKTNFSAILSFQVSFKNNVKKQLIGN